MARLMARIGLVVGAAFVLNGCGTVMNLTGGGEPYFHARQPYGGVSTDVGFVTMAVGGDGAGNVAIAALAVVDLPLSAIADTLTLAFVLSDESARVSDGGSQADVERAASVGRNIVGGSPEGEQSRR
jgi:uncharacterized protein YceK